MNRFFIDNKVEIRHPKSTPTDPPKSFTFDFVYDWNSKQGDLYEETFAPLVPML